MRRKPYAILTSQIQVDRHAGVLSTFQRPQLSGHRLVKSYWVVQYVHPPAVVCQITKLNKLRAYRQKQYIKPSCPRKLHE